MRSRTELKYASPLSLTHTTQLPSKQSSFSEIDCYSTALRKRFLPAILPPRRESIAWLPIVRRALALLHALDWSERHSRGWHGNGQNRSNSGVSGSIGATVSHRRTAFIGCPIEYDEYVEANDPRLVSSCVGSRASRITVRDWMS